jgi:uncharacterized protein YbaR (Trm112 family)
MSKRIPKYLDENSLKKFLCPKCQGTVKVFYYSAIPEVIACRICKIAWELSTEVRYKTERMLKSEANEFMEWGK